MPGWRSKMQTNLLRADQDFSKISRLEQGIISLKDSLAELVLNKPGIKISHALEIIIASYKNKTEEEKQLLSSSIDTLKLYNIKDWTVKRYLPRTYFPSKKKRY